ncbi:unnamed protein product [Ixodes pacificus]
MTSCCAMLSHDNETSRGTATSHGTVTFLHVVALHDILTSLQIVSPRPIAINYMKEASCRKCGVLSKAPFFQSTETWSEI